MFNTAVTMPLQALGVDQTGVANSLATTLEKYRNQDPILGAAWSYVSTHNYQNATFAQAVETTMWLLNAMLSSPQYQGQNPNNVINEGIERILYSMGADQVSKNQMMFRGLNPTMQQQVQRIVAGLPEFEAFIVSFKNKVNGGVQNNFGNFGNTQQSSFGAALQSQLNPGFNQPAPGPSQGIRSGSLLDTMHVAQQPSGIFSGLNAMREPVTNAHVTAPTNGGIDYNLFNSRMSSTVVQPEVQQPQQQPVVAPAPIPGGVKPANSDAGSIVKVIGENAVSMDYEDHRLFFPGSNVTGQEKPGKKADFFGTLAIGHPIAPKDMLLTEDSPDPKVLAPSDVVMFPDPDKSLFSFGRDHAVAMMTAQLIKTTGIDLHRQCYLMDYLDVKIATIFDSESTLALMLTNQDHRNLIDIDIDMDLLGLAHAINAGYHSENKAVKAIAVAMNIAATKAINELVYMEFGITKAGLAIIESFAADFSELYEYLKRNLSDRLDLVEDVLFVKNGPGDNIIRRVRNVVTAPSIEMMVQVSQFLGVDADVLNNRTMFTVNERLLLGLPHTVYDLGIACKPGPNEVNRMETPVLHAALKMALRLIPSEDLTEIPSFHILTADGVSYEVLYDVSREKFVLVW